MTRRELEYNVLHEFVRHSYGEAIRVCTALVHDTFKELDCQAFGKLIASYPELLGEAVKADKSMSWLSDIIAERTAHDVVYRIMGKWLDT